MPTFLRRLPAPRVLAVLLIRAGDELAEHLADVEPRADEDAHIVSAGADVDAGADVERSRGNLKPAKGIEAPGAEERLSLGVGKGKALAEVVPATDGQVEVAQQLWSFRGGFFGHF